MADIPARRFGSGRGNSYDSDWQRCRRYFYWLHHEGVRPASQGDAAPLLVGSAGHAWLEAFYTALEVSAAVGAACALGDEAFEASLRTAIPEAGALGFEVITLEARAAVARQLLTTLAPQFAARVRAGEKTIACELHGTLMLPSEMTYGGKTYTIDAHAQVCTVQCDRVFYHPGDEAQPLAGIALDEFKFTSMASPQMYAEEQLLNDQSLNYLYWLDRAYRKQFDIADVTLREFMQSRGEPVIGVRYRVFRVQGGLTPKSYAEVWETVDRAKLDDWYLRKIVTRSKQSALWDAPMHEWEAARYGFGPCRRFGRECAYLPLCEEPGAERTKIGDAGQPFVYLSATEKEEVKP